MMSLRTKEETTKVVASGEVRPQYAEEVMKKIKR